MTDTYDGPEVIEVDEKGNIIEISEEREKRGRLSDTAEDVVVWSAELKEELRELGVSEWIIGDGGDYRQSANRTIFWFPLDALLEFERADAEIKDDKEFWQAVAEIIKKHQLQTKAERTQKRQRSWSDWKPNFDYGGWKKKASDWWNDYSYGGYSSYGSGSSDLVKKLAIALKAVTVTTNVINDGSQRFRVILSSDQPDAPMSFTDFNSRLVSVSPQALLDTSIEQSYGIEVTTGFALHEGSHVKYSLSRVDAMTKPSVLRPMTVTAMLFNILEDLRIEDLTAKSFPGFAEYFQSSLDYMWSTGKARPTVWGPELPDKMNSIIAIAKWPDKYEDVCRADATLSTEFDWWREWSDSYLAGEPIREALIRALDHLKEDEQTADQMEQMAMAEEEAEKNAGDPRNMSEEEFKDFLEKLREQLASGLPQICPSPSQPQNGQQVQLTEEQGEQLKKLLEEEYQQEESFFRLQDGMGGEVGPTIEISKPLEDQYSKASYRKPGRMVERLRSVFFFRKTAPEQRDRLRRQGFIDEDELWRAGTGDIRIFEQRTQPEDSPTSVTLLIDISGSMQGRGITTAQELANVMMACLRTQRNVRVRVRAHTTGHTGGYHNSCAIYRIWDPGDPDTRIGLLTTLEHGANFDGFAIEWCLKELESTARAGETKVLIVLSDGLPSGDTDTLYYGGHEAMQHMRYVTDKYERQNETTTIQIAVDPDGLRPEDQAIMFKHWIGYESDEKLLRDMTKLLAKVFGSVE